MNDKKVEENPSAELPSAEQITADEQITATEQPASPAQSQVPEQSEEQPEQPAQSEQSAEATESGAPSEDVAPSEQFVPEANPADESAGKSADETTDGGAEGQTETSSDADEEYAVPQFGREEKMRPGRSEIIAYVVTCVAALCAVGFAVWGGFKFCRMVEVGWRVDHGGDLYITIPFYIVCLLIGVFWEQLVHECGHFMVGNILRMGVKMPKIRYFKSSSVELYPYGTRGMKLRFILTVLAGPFFDLLLVILGVVAFSVPEPATGSSSSVFNVVPVLGVVSPYALYSLILNLSPIVNKQYKTDGLVALEMITDKPTAKVLTNILKIQGLLHDGTLFSEIDEGLLLDVPQLPEDDLNFIILTQLRYEYYLQKGNDTKAYKYFRRYSQIVQYLPSEYGDQKNQTVIKK